MTTSVARTFTAVDQVSGQITLGPQLPKAPLAQSFTLVITGTFTATLVLESSLDTVNWITLATYTATQTSLTFYGPGAAQAAITYRVRCTSYTSGAAVLALATVDSIISQVFGPNGQVVFQIQESGPSTPGGFVSPVISGTPTGKIAYNPGQIAVNTLRVASDVVSATTVTIGSDVYEIEIVNTDSTDTCVGGSWNQSTGPVTVLAATYANLSTTVGSLIKIGSEMLRLASAGTYLVYTRAASGTTAAAHVNTTAIYKGDGVTAGRIAVGLVTTLTPTAFTAALVGDINAALGTSAVTAVLISVNEILIKANAVGAVVLATTETLAGTNNAFAATAMYGGAAQSVQKISFQSRVPTAMDVALGGMKFQYDFTPVLVQVYVVITATPGVALAWDGAWTITAGLVTLDNAGTTDWAETNTVYVWAQS